MQYLDLCSVSCCDVGHCPACFLLYGLFGAAQEVQQAGQCRAVQNHLKRDPRHELPPERTQQVHASTEARWSPNIWKKKQTLPGSECRLLSRCCRLRAGQARPPCSRCACNDTTRKTCSLVHRSTPIPQERGQLSCTRRVSLHEQLNQPATHPRVDDRLDLIVGSVRQVGQCPAGVRQHVRVAAEQQSGQHAEAGGHLRQDTVGRRE